MRIKIDCDDVAAALNAIPGTGPETCPAYLDVKGVQVLINQELSTHSTNLARGLNEENPYYIVVQSIDAMGSTRPAAVVKLNAWTLKWESVDGEFTAEEPDEASYLDDQADDYDFGPYVLEGGRIVRREEAR